MNKLKDIFISKKHKIAEEERIAPEFKEYPNLDRLYDNPVEAWHVRTVNTRVNEVSPMKHTTPISDDKIRFVCISDTHDGLEVMETKRLIPPGDVLIHTGDITMHGEAESIYKFNHTIGCLPHKIKLVIAGNHDICLDRSMLNRKHNIQHKRKIEDYVKHYTKSVEKTEVRHLLTNCTYLEDSLVDVCGIKIYGTPWVVNYRYCWGFSLDRGVPLLKKWNLIPDDVDILMSHSPPLGYGDFCGHGYHTGCVDLLNAVQNRVKPKYHIFGHIHEDYGISTDGTTTFINTSSCNKKYLPVNRPIIFDYPVPSGHSKSETVQILKDISSIDDKSSMSNNIFSNKFD